MFFRSARRFLSLHEYQAKAILRENGITVQKGAAATSIEQLEKIVAGLNTTTGIVVKSQVHAGGRGKGRLTSGLQGGVKFVITDDAAKTRAKSIDYAKQMLGYKLITKQTGEAGLNVRSVMLLEGIDIKTQAYLAVMLDPAAGGAVLVYSSKGGVDIEEVAETDPKSIKVYPLDAKTGLPSDAVANEIVKEFTGDLQSETAKKALDQLKKVCLVARKKDATMFEINPWAITPGGEPYVVDSKIIIDENALFRQKEITNMLNEGEHAKEEVDPLEARAQNAGLSFIGLDGNIGCLVNGAGLAMGTMDLIKYKGAFPANFLDIGGSATLDQIIEAFSILLANEKVKSIFVNVFGGIVKCDEVASAIAAAIGKLGARVPLVVRLVGNNADKAEIILKKFVDENKKFKIVAESDFDKAADLAVALAK